MTIKNKIYNLWHGVKRYRGKGCKNVGIMRDKETMVKYDWYGKGEFVFQSKAYKLDKTIFMKFKGFKEL